MPPVNAPHTQAMTHLELRHRHKVGLASSATALRTPISGALASYQMSCDTPPFLHCYAAMYAPQHSRVSFLRAAGYSRRCRRRLFLTFGRLSHDNPASTAAVTFLIAPLTVPFFAVRSVAWIHRSLVTNQDELDLLWPDPLSLTHYQWKYSKEEAPNVIR